MSTIFERWANEGAPTILQPALFIENEGEIKLVETCKYDEALAKAEADSNLIVGFINNEDNIWKLPDRWIYLNTGEVRFS